MTRPSAYANDLARWLLTLSLTTATSDPVRYSALAQEAAQTALPSRLKEAPVSYQETILCCIEVNDLSFWLTRLSSFACAPNPVGCSRIRPVMFSPRQTNGGGIP